MDFTQLIARIEPYIRVENIQGGLRFLTIDGQIYEPREENISIIRDILKKAGYSPFFERNASSPDAPHRLKIGKFKLRQVRQRTWLNWLMLAVTIVSTTIAGAMLEGVNLLADPLSIWRGLPFSFALLLILGSHELGHYFTCRRYGVQATPPFFIPFIPPFGTMGAVIRMGLTPNRRALVRIGAAGPIVGFLVAIPVTIIGILLSHYAVVPSTEGLMEFGEPLIFQGLQFLIKGSVPSIMPLELFSLAGIQGFLGGPLPGLSFMIHPIALAGWLGFLVTALNLLPLSQLDGGHIAYGLFGKRRIYIVIATYAVMAAVSVIFRSWNWLVWGAITLVFGFRHPPAEDEITPLSTGDIIVGIVSLAILILTVMPVPIKIAR